MRKFLISRLNTINFRRLRLSSSGVAMLEMAIALPVVLILLIGVVDLSLAIEKYAMLTRATYEALRFGAKIPEVKSPCIANFQGACPTSNSPEDQAALEKINYRIQKILGNYGISTEGGKLNSKIKIYSLYQRDRSTPGYLDHYGYKLIEVDLELQNNAIFPLFNLIPIRNKFYFTTLYKDIKTREAD